MPVLGQWQHKKTHAKNEYLHYFEVDNKNPVYFRRVVVSSLGNF